MPRKCALALLALVLATGACTRQERSDLPARGESRVLILGIDGATWDLLLPMIEGGELPALAKLYSAGIHGVLRSRNPALSPVVWSTMFTGKLPREHGVVDWKTSQSKHRRVKALWDMTSERGLATDVFNVPSTFPPVPVQGVMIAGFPLGGATLGGNTGVVVSKSGLFDRSAGAHYHNNAKLIRKQLTGVPVGAWTPWFEVAIRGRASWRAAMRVKRLGVDRYYLSPIYRADNRFVFTHPPDLLARLSSVLGGRPYVPEGPGWSKHAEPDTPDYLFEHLVQVAKIQTDAAAAFAGDDWRLFIYVHTLVDRTCHPYWAYMEPTKYRGLSREKADRYADVVHQAYREMDRQLGQLLARVKAPTYVILASDHGFTTNADKRQYIGAHHLDGIFLVAGPGIEKLPAGKADIEDIAPTALYLLGLPVAADMAGDVISEVASAVAGGVEVIPTYEGTSRRRGSDEPVDAETWEQLKGLGYVDDRPRENAE